MIRYILAALLVFSIGNVVSAQYKVAPIFSTSPKIVLKERADGSFVHYHTILKGQTLYALSRTFNINLDKLKNINRKTTHDVSLGENITIPIQDNYLYKGTKPVRNSETVYIPVMYIAKAKDNMYRISKTYFNQSIDEMKARNHMETTSISIGKELIIGWYPLSRERKSTEDLRPRETQQQNKEHKAPITNSPKPSKNQTEAVPTADTDSTLTQKTSDVELITNETVDSLLTLMPPEDFNISLLGNAKYTENMILHEQKQVAHWDKNIVDNGELYVLHNTARPDSYIELYNDLVKRSVRAKVIGKIPFGAYTSDVKLIISPKTAAALGALDERFRVTIQYYE